MRKINQETNKDIQRAAENEFELKGKKAIFKWQSQGATLLLLPKYGGKMAICIGKFDGEYYRQLQCRISSRRVLTMDTSQAIGTIILNGVDIMSPEICSAKGYRDDGKGYTKHLTVMVSSDGSGTLWSLTCTMCSRDENGHICSDGDYSNTIDISVSKQGLEKMLKAVEAYLDAFNLEIELHT